MISSATRSAAECFGQDSAVISAVSSFATLPQQEFYLDDALRYLHSHGHKEVDKDDVAQMLRGIDFFIVSGELATPATAKDIAHLIEVLNAKRKHVSGGRFGL